MPRRPAVLPTTGGPRRMTFSFRIQESHGNWGKARSPMTLRARSSSHLGVATWKAPEANYFAEILRSAVDEESHAGDERVAVLVHPVKHPARAICRTRALPEIYGQCLRSWREKTPGSAVHPLLNACMPCGQDTVTRASGGGFVESSHGGRTLSRKTS